MRRLAGCLLICAAAVAAVHAGRGSARVERGAAPPSSVGGKIVQVERNERSVLAAVGQGRASTAGRVLRSTQKVLRAAKADLDQFRTAGSGSKAGAIAQELGTSDSFSDLQKLSDDLATAVSANARALGALAKGTGGLAPATSSTKRADIQLRKALTLIGRLRTSVDLGCHAAFRTPSPDLGAAFVDVGVRCTQAVSGIYLYFGQAAVADTSKGTVVTTSALRTIDCGVKLQRFVECASAVPAGGGIIVSVSPNMSSAVIDVTGGKGVQRIVWGTP